MRQRLDHILVARGLASTRSQADTIIRLAKVKVNGQIEQKSGTMVGEEAKVVVDVAEQYVSRAGLKLASVAKKLGLDFKQKTVLDVGSSTGGFTDYALQHHAKKIIAVDVGTDQLHPSLRSNPSIELHEKTDIRDFIPTDRPDVVVMDVSFISLRQILPHIATIADANTQIVAMVKPQFEAGRHQISKGVIKNDSIRRKVLHEFEAWAKRYVTIVDKADSEVTGVKGNRERFYLLKLSTRGNSK